jgi:hypothetical protein
LPKLLDLLESIKESPVTEGLNMSRRDYQAITTDPNIKIGFEAEFHTFMYADEDTFNDPHGEEMIEEHYFEFNNTADKLQQFLGTEVVANYEKKDIGYENYQLVPEESIDDLRGDLHYGDERSFEVRTGFELVSPPLPLGEAMEGLQKTFEFIQRHARTSDDTGLHISVSYDQSGERKRFDPLKVALLMGEADILDQFDRSDNANTQSHLQALMHALRYESFEDFASDSQAIQDTISYITSMLDLDKMYTMNLGKFASRGYMEFRAMGGDGYEDRFNAVRNRIVEFAMLMKIGYDSQAYRKQYLKKLFRFVAAVRERLELIKQRQKEYHQAGMDHPADEHI